MTEVAIIMYVRTYNFGECHAIEFFKRQSSERQIQHNFTSQTACIVDVDDFNQQCTAGFPTAWKRIQFQKLQFQVHKKKKDREITYTMLYENSLTRCDYF